MSKTEDSESKLAGARLDPDLHRELRLQAAAEDKPQAEIIREALREYLD